MTADERWISNAFSTLDSPRVLPCLVCAVELKASMPGTNVPSGGVQWSSHGNYGSALWDEVDGRFLSINLCDECVATAAALQRVEVATPFQPPQSIRYEPWTALAPPAPPEDAKGNE